MTIFKFIFRSLWFFRKQQLAILAGTILSTAVLTGALIIGDSVKYSLKELVNIRLGETRYALVSGDRFVSDLLAASLSKKLETKAAAIIIVPGIGINSELNTRLNSIQILGIDNSFWQFAKSATNDLKDDEAIISENTAQKLDLKQGEEILLRIENVSVIPLNAPFASQTQPSVSIRLKIITIVNNDELGRFSLKSNQAAPYNVFVSKSLLAEKLNLKGLANTIILADNKNEDLKIEQISKAFHASWNLSDASIKIKKLEFEGKFELVSDRIFIEDKVSKVIDSLKVKKEPVLTYLINSIRLNEKSTPYSFVSATDMKIIPTTGDKEIVINSWLADDLQAKIGDSIQLDYYIVGSLRNLKEVNAKFKVKAIIPLQKNELYKSLMPSFPGLSDAGHCRDWEAGVPIDLDKIRDKDEDYWNEYKGTPKAYISIASGQKLWKNQFGSLSAIRFDSAIISPAKLERDLLSNLNPQDFNLVFQPVYEQGIAATDNAVDFGELFLSLSFFVIVASLLLTLLIHGLNTESRSAETGLMEGLGFTQTMILKIRILESLVSIVIGGFLGAFVGIIYNYALLAGLNSVWIDVVRTNMISVYIDPKTLAIGSFSGILISILSVGFVSRKELKQAVSILIKRSNIDISKKFIKQSKNAKLIFFISLIGSLAILAYSFAISVDANSSLFLSSGALFLVASIAFVSIYLNRQESRIKYKLSGINNLAIKNTERNKKRSLATITLLSIGVFVILITGANRKTFYGEENLNQSGTGGYLFWAETSIPILYNLNTPEGKAKLGIDDKELHENVTFSQFHSLSGDDASCLNLNQVQKPRILGVNATEFNQRKSFSFASLIDGIDKENPWLSLNQMKNSELIPAVADLTVLTWGIKKEIGDTLIYLNEEGIEIKILIIGGLNNSIFQGNLLIADSIFVSNFPSISGSRVMLVDAPYEKEQEIESYFTNNLADYGIEISQSGKRLDEFNSVTNTYLAVFMALGGLGVLIGTIGLGIVLLRNMLERKPEMALLQAIGFNNKQIFHLILKENLFLLLSGMIIGSFAAIIGILPSILSPSFEIPGTFVFVLMLSVFISGLVWIYFPARNILKWNIIRALQSE